MVLDSSRVLPLYRRQYCFWQSVLTSRKHYLLSMRLKQPIQIHQELRADDQVSGQVGGWLTKTPWLEHGVLMIDHPTPRRINTASAARAVDSLNFKRTTKLACLLWNSSSAFNEISLSSTFLCVRISGPQSSPAPSHLREVVSRLQKVSEQYPTIGHKNDLHTPMKCSSSPSGRVYPHQIAVALI